VEGVNLLRTRSVFDMGLGGRRRAAGVGEFGVWASVPRPFDQAPHIDEEHADHAPVPGALFPGREAQIRRPPFRRSSFASAGRPNGPSRSTFCRSSANEQVGGR
jgi:hypothetical protein